MGKLVRRRRGAGMTSRRMLLRESSRREDTACPPEGVGCGWNEFAHVDRAFVPGASSDQVLVLLARRAVFRYSCMLVLWITVWITCQWVCIT